VIRGQIKSLGLTQKVSEGSEKTADLLSINKTMVSPQKQRHNLD